MNRKNFLKGISLASLGLALPNIKLSAKSKPDTGGECVLIPSESAGPFPLDLTDNQFFFRQDVRETDEGVPINLKMKIIGLDNCGPMPNVRVHIWYCDKDGVYSGYNTGNNPGDPEGTQHRGYQFTDANGEVEFLTILPSWYPGRICHFHFQVHVSSSYSAISQFTFPIELKNETYLANPSIYPKGIDPLGFADDNFFVDGHEYQLATLVPSQTTGHLDSYLEVTVKGTGTTGVGHIERETAKVFELGQNFPNPYQDLTQIPLNLKQAADIKLELWDLSGRKVATILDEKRAAGEHLIDVNPKRLGLPASNYVYQLEAKNSNGVFRVPMMMTCLK